MPKHFQPLLPGFEFQSAIVDAYLAGLSLDAICAKFQLPHKKSIYKRLPKNLRRVKTVSPETREEIINRASGSVRSLAKRYGFSKTTIHRLRTSGDDHYRDEDEEDEEMEMAFMPISWRCPDHGKVAMSPCPICAARGVVRRAEEIKKTIEDNRSTMWTVLS